MKIVIPFLLFFLTACQPHVPDPAVTKITYATSEIVLDTLDNTFWNYGEIYNSPFKKVDSLRLSLNVKADGTYQFQVNDLVTTIFLKAGARSVAFGWDQFTPGKSVHITVADERYLYDYSELTIPVRIFSVRTRLTFSGTEIVHDTVHGVFKEDGIRECDSLRISCTVRSAGVYSFQVNDLRSDRKLISGDTTIAFAWSSFTVGDSVRIGIDDIRYPWELVIPVRKTDGSEKYIDPLLTYCWNLLPSDPGFAQRYNVDSAAHIHLKSVWNTNRGAGIKVAILDNGILPSHEDLQENVYSYWNAETQNSEIPSYGSPYHGTSVAGMVGAVAGNGIGISGVAPESDLILVRFDVDGSDDAEIIRAFTHAKEQGARVINCSWGTYAVSEAVEAIIQEMYDAGIVVIFAAGNYGRNMDLGINDESELPTVIGVGGSSQANDYWTTADYGSNLDVIAPAGGGPGVVVLNGMGDVGNTEYLVPNYRFWVGCSFAAPTVAGVVALILHENPSLTPDQVRSILVSSTDKIGGTNAHYDGNGFDRYRAYGKVNVEKAIALAKNFP